MDKKTRRYCLNSDDYDNTSIVTLLIDSISEVTNKLALIDPLVCDAFVAIQHRLVSETLSLRFAANLANENKGVPLYSAIYPRANYFLDGVTPSYGVLLDDLRYGPIQYQRKHRQLISATFPIRNYLQSRPKNSSYHYYASKINFRKETRVLASNVDYSTSLHARELGQKIGHVYRGCWWNSGKINPDKLTMARIRECSNIWATRSMDKDSIVINKKISNLLFKSLYEICLNLTKEAWSWLKGLEGQHRYFAKELWIVSGGNIWDRMLGLSHKRAGKDVIGHAHADGGGHKLGAQALIDLPPVTDYVSHNLFGTEEVKASINAYGDKNTCVNLTYLKSNHAPKVVLGNKYKRLECTNKTAIYVGTNYQTENPFIISRLGFFEALSLVTEVYEALMQLGWKMVYKPHPEIAPTIVPFIESLGIECDLRPFEYTVFDADILIYDQPSSTTFGASVSATSLPIILIDTLHQPWMLKAKRIIEDRCALLHPLFNEDEYCVDPTTLANAIEEAYTLREDRGCAQTIYLNTDYDLRMQSV